MSAAEYEVVIATTDTNSNGHRYTAETLQEIADKIQGVPVLEREPSMDSKDGDLSLMCGMAVSGIFDGHALKVRIKGDVPWGKFITPTGKGVFSVDDRETIRGYSLEHLTVSTTSAFDKATKVL